MIIWDWYFGWNFPSLSRLMFGSGIPTRGILTRSISSWATQIDLFKDPGRVNSGLGSIQSNLQACNDKLRFSEIYLSGMLNERYENCWFLGVQLVSIGTFLVLFCALSWRMPKQPGLIPSDLHLSVIQWNCQDYDDSIGPNLKKLSFVFFFCWVAT